MTDDYTEAKGKRKKRTSAARIKARSLGRPIKEVTIGVRKRGRRARNEPTESAAECSPRRWAVGIVSEENLVVLNR